MDEVHQQRALVGDRDLDEVDPVEEVHPAHFVPAALGGTEVLRHRTLC